MATVAPESAMAGLDPMFQPDAGVGRARSPWDVQLGAPPSDGAETCEDEACRR